jgi:hypothetical protein
MTCSFYREDSLLHEQRGQEPAVTMFSPLPPTAPWCAHLYSPVTKYVATKIAGGPDRLCCDGDLAKCQVLLPHRPTKNDRPVKEPARRSRHPQR